MTSSLAKSKQIIGVHFQTLFSTIFLVFDVPQYSNRFNYIKDIRPAIYFNTKKLLHITFKYGFKPKLKPKLGFKPKLIRTIWF